MIYLMMRQRAVLYSIISLGRLILQLTLKIVFITVFKMGVLGALYASLAASALSTIVLLIFITREIQIGFSMDLWKKMIAYSFPLLGSWIGQFSINFSDRFFLTKLSDLSEVGIYALAYKFGMLSQMLVSGPFMMTWGPKRFEVAADADSPRLFAKMFTYFVLAQMFFVTGISIMAKPILILMAEPSYHSAHQYIPVISLSYLFQGSFMNLQFAHMYRKKTSIIGIVVLTSAAVNLVLNYILINYFGIWGAASATIISYSLMCVLIFKSAQRHFYIPFETGRLLKIVGCALVCYAPSIFIELSSFWFTAAIKVLLVAAFPVLLFVTGVFQKEEIQTLRRMIVRRTA